MQRENPKSGAAKFENTVELNLAAHVKSKICIFDFTWQNCHVISKIPHFLAIFSDNL
jgi:hypothetical protein